MAPFDPDPRQRSVLEHTTGPLLVTGGFGTGKTAVLRERFARLIETGADPERVALVVGSGRARDRARAALLDRLGIALPRLTVVTIQGLAFHVVGERYEQLGYEAPPRVLSASEQRDRVRELLGHEDPERWPVYAGLLPLRGFGDEVRQFVIRAQEALLPPDEIERRAKERGLAGWSELAAFLRHYLAVLDASKEVDFAGLVEQAAAAVGEGDRPFDHVIVDDYQDTTFGAERLLAELRPGSLVVAGDPGAHVFSFQGTTDVPLRRFVEGHAGAAEIELDTPHRPRPATIEAWRAAHVSEQHAAVAREVRRIHVEERVPWRDIAIVARRHGTHEAGMLRALDDAHIPRAISERGTYRLAAATRPFLLALRWAVAGPQERDALAEPVLTSELGGLSPATARTLLRLVRAHGLPARESLGRPDLAAPEEAAGIAELGAVLAEAERHDGSVLRAFEALWRGLPYSSELVRRAETDHQARLDLDAVLQLSRAVSEAGSSPDPSVEAFLLLLGSEDSDELATGIEAAEDAIHVLTAHAATGRGFDTVVVVDALEGDFPSLSRPEPMFDLGALDGTSRRSETNRLRLADERRLFAMVCSRARRRVLFTATDPHGDRSGVTLRSRFVEELDVEWTDAPSTPFVEPVSVAEAASAWRRVLADPKAPVPERLSSLEGLLALGDDPGRWWFQRDWTDVEAEPRDRLYLSFSRLGTLENCELQYVLSSELGLDPGGGYQAWVGHLVHRLIEDCERGEVERTREAFERVLDERWEPARFPSFAISEAERANAKRVLIPNWFARYADPAATATEQGFEFEFEGAAIRGKIDRIGPGPDGATRITDYKTGRSDNAPRVSESLQLGIYYLAVDGTDDLAEHRPVGAVELAYLGGRKKDSNLDVQEWPISKDEEEEYKTRMRERIGTLVERIHALDRDRRYVASTAASCFFCRFQPLCTRYPQGGAVFPIPDAGGRDGGGTGARRARAGRTDAGRRDDRRPATAPPRDMSATYPEPIVEFLGGDPTPEQWRAISWPLEPCVVVAGAGSGKTSVMAARVIYLAMVATGAWRADHPGVMPGDVLCLTFTNKATENLMIRIRRALRTLDLPEGEEPEILNYHAFAAQVLERHGMLIGLEPGVRVLSQAQKTEIAARVLDRMTFDEQHTRWQPAIVGYITDLDEQLANHLVEPEAVVEHVQGKLEALRGAPSDEPFRAGLERIEIARAVRVFRDLKAELGVIDFGDQIAHAVRIVSEHPEVGDAYRERFGAVLLDEYQDTNHAQAALMRGVFGSAHPVTAVGDPDQNIYAWRGASLRNLLQFPVEFRRADDAESARLPLYTNFRSGARILGAADRVIGALPPAQRPDPDKVLRPWEPNGEGAVWVAHFEHEISEAEGIADAIAHLHETGTAWKDCAVLCRTHRLFEALQLAFAERKVPAEFVNLTGLIHLPEVVELLAYARAAEDPADGVALARILTGPRFRIGLRDLARVAAWSRRSTAAFIQALDELELREDEDLLEDHPFLMAEALEHLDEVEGLSDAGRDRLEEFRAELAELRSAARRPVGEFLAEIIRRTGLLAELDAAVDVEMASARRRNLAAFLEQVHAFQPVEGELTLRAFLDHVDAIEDDREWTPVQPSEDDSVKVMTVHAAKGLEFDNVYVPGLARGLFPDVRIQQNPTRKGSSLDVELRRDGDLLPTFQGNMKAFTDELRNQEEYEERRICYVALTRARRRLFVSSANWYGEAHRAKGMGPFFIELKRWGEGAGAHVTFEGGGEEDDEEERSQTNPLAGYRQRFVRPWPGPARPDDADELFEEGWRRAAAEAAGAGRVPEARLHGLAEPERAAFADASAARRTLAAHLVAQESAMDEAPAGPSSVSVGGLIGYARCPKLYYWSAVRPLPTFAGPSARIGTEIHRWIEMRSRGQATLLELEDEPDVTAEELAGTPGRLEDLRRAYARSRFGDMVPLYAERPFLLPIEGVTIKGRIDAIYGAPDGPWEVVDYKTGRLPPDDDPLARVQLDLYALACIEVWHKAPEDLRLTYLYLSSGQERSHTIDDVGAIRRRIGAWLRAIGAGEFDPTPGEQCRWCDFRAFCPPGRAWYEANASS